MKGLLMSFLVGLGVDVIYGLLRVKSLGYGDPSTLFPRLPRLSFNEACSLL